MFVFGKKKQDRYRKWLRDEFETLTTTLRSADNLSQVAVGHSINMANSLFFKKYSGPSGFQKLPKSERISYINKLTEMSNKLNEEKDDPHSALGFGLFKMWVVAVAEFDTELMQQFSNELAYFSKKGDLPM